MAYKNTPDIIIEDARIFFKNFSGKGDQYNREGDRNFCVYINEEDAQKLYDDGWNVKYTKPRNEDDESKPYIQVKVSFDNVPPKVIMISGRTKIKMDEESIGELDYAEIRNIDMTISPYHWEVSGKSGIKAYLKTMYVTIAEDPFADKYADEY